jgi:dihydroflavonol-4-reductase
VRVLVTGASGFVGSWVARELLARGHAVRALVRATSKMDNLSGLALERVEGDVLDRAAMERALAGCDGLVHTAGLVSLLPADAARAMAVNAGGTEVVRSAARAAGVKRAVLTSSTAVMGGSSVPRVADENTPGNVAELGIDYFISKLRAEQVAMGFAERGLPVCAVRPGYALGPGDVYRSGATTVLSVARRSLTTYVRGGTSFCDVRDVARGHAAALERGVPGEAYILGGHNLEMDEFMRAVARAAGVPPPRRVPYAVAWAAAAGAELAGLLGKRGRISRQLIRASGLYSFVNSARAMAELGYAIRPFAETLADTLRYFIAQGRLEPRTPELAALAAAPAR